MAYPSLRTLLITGVALFMSATCGCTQTSLFHRNKVVKAEGANPAAEIISLWQPAKGPGISRVQGRGLAGQILFFTRGSAAPAVVEGDVRIYLFDNLGTPEEQSRPIWQFDFPAQDWQTFAQMGALGPAYNVFVPYPREGQNQVECAIQIRFSPKDGPVVYSEMTSVTLPGRIDAEEGGFLPDKTPKSAAPQTLPATAQKSAQPLPRNSGARLGVHSIRPKLSGGIEQASYTMTSDADGEPAPIQTASHQEPARHPLLDAPRPESHPLETTGDARLQELEQTVREMMRERAEASAGGRRPIQEEGAAETTPQPMPRRTASKRFRLESTQAAGSSSGRHPLAHPAQAIEQQDEVEEADSPTEELRTKSRSKPLRELLDNATW